jgi:hypothetical protein
MNDDRWSGEEADDPVLRAEEIEEAQQACNAFLLMMDSGHFVIEIDWTTEVKQAVGVLWMCSGMSDDGTVPPVLRSLGADGVIFTRVAEQLPAFLKKAERLIAERRPRFERRAELRRNPPNPDDVPF